MLPLMNVGGRPRERRTGLDTAALLAHLREECRREAAASEARMWGQVGELIACLQRNRAAHNRARTALRRWRHGLRRATSN
jgi:hypothetical protein